LFVAWEHSHITFSFFCNMVSCSTLDILDCACGGFSCAWLLGLFNGYCLLHSVGFTRLDIFVWFTRWSMCHQFLYFLFCLIYFHLFKYN
jgi:hypothetical protein